MENTDLKYLKKHYGEKFAHLCRELFPTILEHEGMLSEIISRYFAPTRSLYEDVLPVKENFREFILSRAKIDNVIEEEEVTKTPEQLMDEAGYILYPECQSEKDIQSFKKYWKQGEELCTFRGGRLDSCRVWFAVKKNIDQIKRENFTEPKRQDEYGTSAISIQFTRGEKSTLSIKNRYNHTVSSPDATFGNNLDNIIHGLTQSFVKTFNINLTSANEGHAVEEFLNNYAPSSEGKYYRVNIEARGIEYCENNKIVKFGRLVEFDKARYILAENYIIDKQAKLITPYDKMNSETSAFVDSIGEIKDMTFKTDEEGNRVVVCTPKEGEDVEITLNGRNEIIGYKNPNVTEIGDCFLKYNKSLQKLELPNVTEVGKDFLYNNQALTKISLPKLKIAGFQFLGYNRNILEVNLPQLTTAEGDFLRSNRALKKLSLPSLVSTGNGFLSANRDLEELDLPRLEYAGNMFLSANRALKRLSLPKLLWASDWFLEHNEKIDFVDLPLLQEIGDNFLLSNQNMTSLSLPSLETAREGFLFYNERLASVNLPKLKTAGGTFLYSNQALSSLSLPELKYVGPNFLSSNTILKKLYLPKLEVAGYHFLNDNLKPSEYSLQNLSIIGEELLGEINKPRFLDLKNLANNDELKGERDQSMDF